jgi:hypothetical protein
VGRNGPGNTSCQACGNGPSQWQLARSQQKGLVEAHCERCITISTGLEKSDAFAVALAQLTERTTPHLRFAAGQ